MSYLTITRKTGRVLFVLVFALTSLQISLPALGNNIEEIVVTARKRDENLQDVPAAVSAFTGDELIERGIDRIEELQRLTPNLTINETSGLTAGAVQVFIRGIGSDPGFDQGVGVYVDDVYLNRTFGAMLELFDVERIEVLKGPQGHLYGRNTIGGAIKYVTRKPTNETRGFVEAKVGTDSLRKVKAGISGALSEDSLYGSFAFMTEDRDGYQTNLFDGDEYGSSEKQAARGTLIWDIRDNLSAKFTADYFKDESDPLVATRIAVNAANLQNVFQNLLGLGNLFVPGSAYLTPGFVLDTSLPTDEDHVNTAHTDNGFDLFEIETNNYSLTLDWDINDSWSLKSVTAFRDQDSVAPYDFDGSDQVFINTTQPFETEDFSQEFQLNYTGDSVNAVVGLYYLDGERVGTSETQQTALLRLLTDHHKIFSSDVRELKSRSFYANVDWDINDQWQLSLGGRYTKDEKDTARLATVTLTQHPTAFLTLPGLEQAPVVLSPLGAQIFPNLPFFGFFLPHRDENGNIINFGSSTTVTTFDENNFGSEDWSEFSPSARLRYTHSDDLMLYAGYSSGFKSGGFLPSGRQLNMPTFDPEIVDTFSVGLKSTLANGSVRLNAEFFLNDYQDKQVAVVTLDENSQLVQTSDNVGEVESRGAEVEILWLPPVDGLSFNLNIGYLDVDIDELIDALPDGTVGNAADFRELGFSPELTWQARVQYEFPLGDAGTMTIGADAAYRDEMYTDSPVDISNEFFRSALSDDLTTYNAFLTYRSNDDRWRVSLEGKNLSDERAIVNTFNVTDFILGGYNRGRTWGLTVGYNFN